MPRPQLHSPDTVLDAAEGLLVERGRAQLTIRALAERAVVSNGSIYHAFGSLETVIGRTWLRRAEQFLALQRAAVDQELAAGHSRRAVQAAADAPGRLAEADLRAAQLLVTLPRDDVLTDAVAPEVADRLRGLDAALVDTLRTLSRALWERGDSAAVDLVTTCVVRLPAALLFPDIRAGHLRPLTRTQLAATVNAVLDCGPPA
jgi:AcrR family transcriptional regulator